MSVTDLDPAQREHLRKSPWMRPEDCYCRLRNPADPGSLYVVCKSEGCGQDAKCCGGYCRPCFDALMAQVAADSGPNLDCAHLRRQREWSRQTFGPGRRTLGVLDHIRKELLEIEADPDDWTEWIDVVILALDGAWRHGAEPRQILDAIVAKQAKNEARTWPDWRTLGDDQAIEHDRSVPDDAEPPEAVAESA